MTLQAIGYHQGSAGDDSLSDSSVCAMQNMQMCRPRPSLCQHGSNNGHQLQPHKLLQQAATERKREYTA